MPVYIYVLRKYRTSTGTCVHAIALHVLVDLVLYQYQVIQINAMTDGASLALV